MILWKTGVKLCDTIIVCAPGGSTYSLALHCSPLPAKDILELGEMLDKSHHLGLEALGVDVLH